MTDRAETQRKSDVLPVMIPVHALGASALCARRVWFEEVAGERELMERARGAREATRSSRAEVEDWPEPNTLAAWQRGEVMLRSASLGFEGLLERVESPPGTIEVVPVVIRHGKGDALGQVCVEDRMEAAAFGLMLRERGYQVREVAVHYADGARHDLALTPTLEAHVRGAAAQVRGVLETLKVPRPLAADARCGRCPMLGICQPDEVWTPSPIDRQDAAEVGRVHVQHMDTEPLYIQEPGARVGVRGEELVITSRDGTRGYVGLGRVHHVTVVGHAHLSPQAIMRCLSEGLPIFFMSSSGWMHGGISPTVDRRALWRMSQHETIKSPRALPIARALIADKIANGRTLLRRRMDAHHPRRQPILDALGDATRAAEHAESAETLLGVEGHAARLYWEGYASMLAEVEGFAMRGRTRRPPRDLPNALLSYGYGVLLRECIHAINAVGLDPCLGVFHKPHHGQPALALDLMEPLRPLIVDSAVLRLIKNHEVTPEQFFCGAAEEQGVSMRPEARRALIAAIERRLHDELTHPALQSTMSWRRAILAHAQLLRSAFAEEISAPPALRTR